MYMMCSVDDRGLPKEDRHKVSLRLPRTMSRARVGEPQRSLRQHFAINDDAAQSLGATRNRINEYLAQEGYTFTGNGIVTRLSFWCVIAPIRSVTRGWIYWQQ
jgi:hypothetical protein